MQKGKVYGSFEEALLTWPAKDSDDVICPVCSHERKPENRKKKCLSVDKQTDGTYLFMCHHCDYKGKIAIKMNLYSLPKKEPKPEYKEFQVSQNKECSDFLISRGFDLTDFAFWDDCIKCVVKNGRAWIRFSEANEFGEITGSSDRACFDKQFTRQTGSVPQLFFIPRLIESKNKSVILCEGQIDALSFWASGKSNAISLPAGVNSSVDWLLANPEYQHILIATDNDEAGEKCLLRLASILSEAGRTCYRIKYPAGCKDANDVLVKYGREAVAALVKPDNRQEIKPPAQSSQALDVFAIPESQEAQIQRFATEDEVFAYAYNIFKHGHPGGLKSSITEFNSFVQWHTGKYVLVTGVSSSGKSELVNYIVNDLCVSNSIKCMFFSPEHSIETHIERIFHMVTNTTLAKNSLNSKYPPKQTAESEIALGVEKINRYFVFDKCEYENLTIESICEAALDYKTKNGSLKIIVIDPWSALNHNYNDLMERQETIRELNIIRNFARQHGFLIFVIVHPTKTSDKQGRPVMSHFMQASGAKEFGTYADSAIVVKRDAEGNRVEFQKIKEYYMGEPSTFAYEFDPVTRSYYFSTGAPGFADNVSTDVFLEMSNEAKEKRRSQQPASYQSNR